MGGAPPPTAFPFPLLTTPLQAWEGSSEMSEASLLAHQKGLHLVTSTLHTRAIVTMSGVEHGGSLWGLVPHSVLMTLISKSPKT